MSAVNFFSFSASLPSLSNASSLFTFKVGDETLQIETRFLLPCDYFNKMFSQNFAESTSRVIEVHNCSKETVEIFLQVLKTYKLPVLNEEQLIELYGLVHLYQHHALLDQVRSQLIQQVSSHLSSALVLAVYYSDEELKKSCQEYVKKHTYENRNLLSNLIDEEYDQALEEVLTWESFSHFHHLLASTSYDKKLVDKLIEKRKYFLAYKLLEIACRKKCKNDVLSSPQNCILGILDQSLPPSDEQTRLIELLAKGDPSVLSSKSYYKQDDTLVPIFTALVKGWDELFERMLKLCGTSVAMATDAKGATLLGYAVGYERIKAIQAMKAASCAIDRSLYSAFVLVAIKSKNLELVKELLSFPITHNYTPNIGDECIEAAITTQDLKILAAVWPYYTQDEYKIKKLRLKAYEEDQLSMGEILFSKGFNAYDELPRVGGIQKSYTHKNQNWLNHAVVHAKLSWIKLMIKKGATLNREHDRQPPLSIALSLKKKTAFILELLKLGANIDTADTSEKDVIYPLHQMVAYEDSVFLSQVLNYKPDLKNINAEGNHFFHLYFKTKVPLLDSLSLVTLLAKDGKSLLSIPNKEGNVPLHLAIQRYMLLRETKHAQSALEEIGRLVLLEPTTLWSINKQKESTLKVAKGPAFEEVMQYLIEQGKKEQAGTLSKTLLLWCGKEYLYHFCQKLFLQVKNIETVVDAEGRGLLHYAAAAGAPQAVHKLVEMGIPVNAQDKNYKTPLHYAVEKQHVDLVKDLLTLGADIKKCDDKGDTPLSLALKLPRTNSLQEIIKVLESNTCSIM